MPVSASFLPSSNKRRHELPRSAVVGGFSGKGIDTIGIGE
jgi:hypothetical protein